MTFPAGSIAYQARYAPADSIPMSHNQSLANLHMIASLNENEFRWPQRYGERLQPSLEISTQGFVFPTHLPEKLSPTCSSARYHDVPYNPDQRFTESSRTQDPRLYLNARSYDEDHDMRLQQLSRAGLDSARQHLTVPHSYDDLRYYRRNLRGVSDSKLPNLEMRQTIPEIRYTDAIRSPTLHSVNPVEEYGHGDFVSDSMADTRLKVSSEPFHANSYMQTLSKQIAQQRVIAETMKHLPTQGTISNSDYYVPRLPHLSPPLTSSVGPARETAGQRSPLDEKDATAASVKSELSLHPLPELQKPAFESRDVRTESPTSGSLPMLLLKSNEAKSPEALAKLSQPNDVIQDDSSKDDTASTVESSNSSRSGSETFGQPSDDGEVLIKQDKDSESGLPSYTAMIAQAILKREGSKSTLAEIYEYMEKSFPSLERRGTGWRNCVRHTLSLNDCFIKLHRPENGRSCNWAIHPSYFESFSRGDYRKRRALRKRPRGQHWMDPLMMSALSYARDLPADLVPPVPLYHYPHNFPALWPSAHINYHQPPPVASLQHYPPNPYTTQPGTHCTNPACYCQRHRVYTT